MHTVQIRNVPEWLYIKLKKSAKEARRSLNQHAIVLWEMSLATSEFELQKERRDQALDAMKRNRKLSKEEANKAIEWVRKARDSR